MFINYLFVFGVALLPFVELRLAIPIGIGMGLSPVLIFFTAIIADILLGFILIEILFLFDKWIPEWKFLRLGKLYMQIREKSKKKLQHFTEKYGVWGVAIFIGVPLPGTGVYTGTLGAFLIGLDKQHYRKSCVLGVILAGIIVTLLSVGAFSIF